MKLTDLQWDSAFFGMRISRLDVDESDDVRGFSQDVLCKNDLVYIFAKHGIEVNVEGGTLVDRKVIYWKNIAEPATCCCNVKPFEGLVPSEDLYRLSLQSGIYSRFKLDTNFPAGSYERLYCRWIEQSVNGAFADVVLCYYVEEKIEGMVTVSVKDGTGVIGLVAVDSPYRKVGIGSELLRAVDVYLYEHKIYRVEVATQYDNKNARAWYEKNGFAVKEQTDIYHWWKKN